MSETGKKETLSLTRGPRRLDLRKTVETGQVKQSFSHGRTKTVQVEVRRKRSFGRGAEPEPAPQTAPPAEVRRPEAEPEPEHAAVAAAESEAAAEREQRIRHVLPTLSEAEKAARARALEDARKADQESRRRVEDEARRRAEDTVRMAAEREAAEARRKDEEARKKAEDESRRKAEEEAERRLREQEERRLRESGDGEDAELRASGEVVRKVAVDEEEIARAKRAAVRPKTPLARRGEPRRRSGRLTVTQALGQPDGEERVRSLASVRRERERLRQQRQAVSTVPEPPGKVVRDVVIPEALTVQELANRMAERAADVIKALMKLGMMATINQSIDADTAELIVAEFGHRAKRVSAADVEVGLEGVEDEAHQLKPRPPVVTVMGHVDHGKTSLLDAIRQADVAAGEAGGITQHIGAYQVETAGGGRITFIDTPGHEAFTEMRARGAKVTDLVILVVAADDSVMPQTVEAINHARAAGVPMIVAINKIDRPDADPNRVKQALLQHEVVPEEMGGDVQVVEVSALQKINLDGLEEAILLQSELLELTANPERMAQGVVIEAKLERGRGPVATVLVQRGTLRGGDVFVAGSQWGRVRALVDDRGRNVEQAGPSVPVEVLGLAGAPNAGDEFTVVESEARAREVSDYRQQLDREQRVATGAGRGSLEQMMQRMKSGELAELPVVIKGDVQGSVEAIVGALEKLRTDEVGVRVLHTGVGGIIESDVTLAKASDAMIIGFNVRANAQARELARRDEVELRYYSIIYELVDEMKAVLSGMLAPEVRETVLGNAQVLEVFNITKVGKIAGCKMTSGLVRRNAKVRLLRDDIVVHEGSLRSLRRFKEDVREVREGNECGIALENYQDIQPGDVLEFYEVEEVQRAL